MLFIQVFVFYLSPLDLITLVIVGRLVLLPQVFVQMLNEFV